MPRILSPIKALSEVSDYILKGPVQARKRILTGCPYTHIKTGQIFEIFTFEPTNGAAGEWRCTCRDMKGKWFSIPEDYFDWDTDSFEMSMVEAREAELVYKDARRLKKLATTRSLV